VATLITTVTFTMPGGGSNLKNGITLHGHENEIIKTT
jgi:hypothetical protein